MSVSFIQIFRCNSLKFIQNPKNVLFDSPDLEDICVRLERQSIYVSLCQYMQSNTLKTSKIDLSKKQIAIDTGYILHAKAYQMIPLGC